MTFSRKLAQLAKNSFNNVSDSLDAMIFDRKYDQKLGKQKPNLENYKSIFHETENQKNPRSKHLLIKQQWRIYKQSYRFLERAISTAASHHNDNVYFVSVSRLGSLYLVNDIAKQITVDPNTILAEISCVDEATQGGEFVRETDLEGNYLGSMSDHTIDRYILSIPGSGALKYICPQSAKEGLSLSELIEVERNRLADLGYRISKWCQKKGIVKLTMTYHEACGAVQVRKKNLINLLTDTNQLQMAKQCATNLGFEIQKASVELKSKLNVTLAFIGKNEMFKLRPMQMHNALGTIGCLDSSILCMEIDLITRLNFFDCLVPVEFDEGLPDHNYSLDAIASGVEDINLTIQIAFGEHGWGASFFNKARPYMVMLFTRSEEQSYQAQDLVRAMKLKLTPEIWEKLAFVIIRSDQ